MLSKIGMAKHVLPNSADVVRGSCDWNSRLQLSPGGEHAIHVARHFHVDPFKQVLILEVYFHVDLEALKIVAGVP
jgi:hypothetical protein